MTWSIKNSKGNEAKKIRWELVPYTRGEGLDIGCGAEKAFPHFVGVDNMNHEQFGWSVKPDVYFKDASKLDKYASQSWDFVFSSHLLEHIENYKETLKEWWRVIKPGGHLVLYLPHAKWYPRKGAPHSNPDHKHDFFPSTIIDAMKEINGWDLLENQERGEGDEYSFFQVYKKLQSWSKKEPHFYSYDKPKPEKTAAVIRYGAFGDLMQATSVIKGLKDQGFHVTLYTSPPGSDVILHDPNIDKLILQDKDQVPNGNLGEFWEHEKKKYTRFVNLSESVEGTLLAMPGRANHEWPFEMRQKYLNENYVEFQHQLAEVPHNPQIKFYATDDEKAWAKKERSKLGDFVIVWSLAGSSVHKTWPHVDPVLARIMIEYKDSNVVFVGGADCALLESNWEKEKRVIRTCGKWNIRQSLAFLEVADLVIGPETGVLNAASMMDVPKICLLSHSSVNNLTRDWVNTTSLYPKNTVCYPCHMLHYTWKFCNQSADEKCPACNESEKKYGARACEIHTGTAQCQTDIHPSEMWDAIRSIMDNKLRKAA